jgi:gliding motility-associated-like protein
VIIDINYNASDTTLLFDTSCIPADTGIVMTLLTNMLGCDSLVIETTYFSLSDTTYIPAIVCSYADTGVTETLYINQNGCDSVVIENFYYGGNDTTFLTLHTCSAIDSGYAYVTLENQAGCDSVISAYSLWISPDTTYLNSTTCAEADTGTIITHFTNEGGCDSMVISHVTLLPIEYCVIEVSSVFLAPLCMGDSGVVTVSAHIGLAPITVEWAHEAGAIEGATLIGTNPGQALITITEPGKYFIEATSAAGLKWMDTIEMPLIPELTVHIHHLNNHNGFDLACAGDLDGMLDANAISPGTPPYTYEWSNGSFSHMIHSLGSGNYAVTITDLNGCTAESITDITAPTALSFETITEDASCFDLSDGQILISEINGGIPPYESSVNNSAFDPTTSYTNLPAGEYLVELVDHNGCSVSESVEINSPPGWSIDLGPDTSVTFGNSFIIHSMITGFPQGNVTYIWTHGDCLLDCKDVQVSPLSNLIVEVSATDENGCVKTDEISLHVLIDRNIYIPNAFTPDHDGINDEFRLYSGAGVASVDLFTIYDRWGNILYQASLFLPNDPSFAWDGTSRGQLMNPGVYVYKFNVTYVDGKEEVLTGNVTLIR